MADTRSIALTRSNALARLNQAMDILGKELDIAPIKLTTYNVDPAFLHARQLSEMADYLDALVAALFPTEALKTASPIANGSTPDFTAMNKAEVVSMAETLGMEIGKTTTKTEAEAFIRSSTAAGG